MHSASASLLALIAALSPTSAGAFDEAQVSRHAPTDLYRPNIDGLTLRGTHRMSFLPTANPVTPKSHLGTYGALVVQGTTIMAANREFLASFGFTSDTGADQPDESGNGDKVPLYAGMDQRPGSGNAWSLNTVIGRASGVTKSTIGYEIDLNNNDQHLGEGLGLAGVQARPFSFGLIVTGAAPYRSTGAIEIGGPGTQIWNRGLVVSGNSVKQASFQDTTVADISVDIRGGHIYPIDLANSGVVRGAIRLPLGNAIVAGKPDSNGIRDDKGNVNLISTDVAGNVFLTKDGTGVIISGTSFLPQGTTQDLGNTGSPWRNVYGRSLIIGPGAPASSSAACVAGQMQTDTNYIYVCVAANTWKRSALSSW